LDELQNEFDIKMKILEELKSEYAMKNYESQYIKEAGEKDI
jgi:hypothetical protein